MRCFGEGGPGSQRSDLKAERPDSLGKLLHIATRFRSYFFGLHRELEGSFDMSSGGRDLVMETRLQGLE